MTTGQWGPFLDGIDAAELKARTRTLRLSISLAAGERGKAAAFALLCSEIGGGDPDLLDEARVAFDQLAPLDRRKALSIYQRTT